MTLQAVPGFSPAETDDLIQSLEPLLNRDSPIPLKIAELKRSSSPYASSYPLEEVVVLFESGRRLEMIFKDVRIDAHSDAVRRAKPDFLFSPLREMTVYQTLLDSRRLGTARYFGSVVNESRGRYWLFLENVDGDELYTVGDFQVWKQTARWLAQFHDQMDERPDFTRNALKYLIQYDTNYFNCWIERALTFTAAADERRASASTDFLRRLASEYSRWVDELAALRKTVIHGDFYPSNIIIDAKNDPPRVCAVDWEQAAFGPGLVDLASLTSGNWNEQQREELAREYYQLSQRRGIDLPDWRSFLRAFELCRLHLAIQWLGWSPDWSPPDAHRQDWLTIAQDAYCRLNGN
ncbi:MAG: aminoglycoside phosphotransferase family protein [Planctomycetaceae bacterium]